MTQKNVLILCTGNSCRSQMAEGLINHELGAHWHAVSAGTKPAGYVHPLAVEVMAELGIDLTQQRSKSVDEFQAAVFDMVITVCDDAATDCPLWLGSGPKVHLSFIDPARATGTHPEQLAIFRQVRDQIRQVVLQYLISC